MNLISSKEQFDTVVIGGGQAGLAVGYYLTRLRRHFVILDSSERVGTAWRKRWDSLRLFSPTGFSSLPGMPFPAPPDSFPTKDEMADYLEAYATRFELPIQLGVSVNRLTRENDRYILTVDDRRIEANYVIVATGAFHQPKIPAFASELDPGIVQLHSNEYRHPGQLQEGDVLIVGAGNSGAEVAVELAKRHRTWLAGRDTGRIPLRLKGQLFWSLLNKVLTVDTTIGRRMRKGSLKKGGPLIRLKPKDLVTAGVNRVPRAVGVKDGKPVLEDERVLDVANVIWCTGFVPDFRWIDLPVFGNDGYPVHYRGVVEGEPGLYFLGLPFQYAFTSSLIGGVGRDAKYIAEHIEERQPARVEKVEPAEIKK